MLTTNQNTSSPNPFPLTPEQARRQAERCGRAALRGVLNRDPSVVDDELATAVAMEQSWMMQAAQPQVGSPPVREWYLGTRTALLSMTRRGCAGITGQTAAMRRAATYAAEAIRITHLREDVRDDQRDFVTTICEQDFARGQLAEIAALLTPRARGVLEIALTRGGYLPGATELAQMLGISRPTARKILSQISVAGQKIASLGVNLPSTLPYS